MKVFLPSGPNWFWSVKGWSRDEAPGSEEQEEGRFGADGSSPAEREARPASSDDSPVCSSAERPGNAPRPGRNDGWA